MKHLVRGAREAERMLANPVARVRALFEVEHVPGRVVPDLGWVMRSPLDGIPLSAAEGAEPSTDLTVPRVRRLPGFVGADGGSRNTLEGRAGSNPAGTGQSMSGADGRRERSAGIHSARAAAPPPRPAGAPPAPGIGAAEVSRSNAPAHERPFGSRAEEGQPVFSLRRISRLAESGPREPEGREARAAPELAPLPDRSPVPPSAGPERPSATPVERPSSGVPVPVGGRPNGNGQAEVVRSALDRLSSTTADALRRSSPIAGERANEGIPENREGSGRSGPRLHPRPRVGPAPRWESAISASVVRSGAHAGPESHAPADRGRMGSASSSGIEPALPDPAWILEVIGEALADQARREGVDLS